YNIAPSLDFDRDPKMDQMFGAPSKGNSPSFKIPEIQVDRSYNPFLEEIQEATTEVENLAEQYHHSIEAAPSKINLFEDEEFDEDLMRLPNGYWLLNKGEKTLMLDLGRMHRLVVAEKNKNRKKEQVSHALLFSLEYHMNEIEKNKYKSIKKFLPELGFDIKVAHENVLRVDAVPTG